MTSYDANGASVEGEATVMKRYAVFIASLTELPMQDAFPLNYTRVVLASDHDAAIAAQEAQHEEEIAARRSILAKCEADRDSLSTALAAERERAGRMEVALTELVRLKDLHDACEDQTYWATRAVARDTIDQLRAWEQDYKDNKQKAWIAARAALARAGEGEKNG